MHIVRDEITVLRECPKGLGCEQEKGQENQTLVNLDYPKRREIEGVNIELVGRENASDRPKRSTAS